MVQCFTRYELLVSVPEWGRESGAETNSSYNYLVKHSSVSKMNTVLICLLSCFCNSVHWAWLHCYALVFY